MKLDEMSATVELLEEGKKHLQCKLEVVRSKYAVKASAYDKLCKHRSRLQQEVIDLDSQRQLASNLIKKLRKFDQMLAEERLVSSKCAKEHEWAESRGKETQVLALSREREEIRGELEEAEKNLKAIRAEVEDLNSCKETVHELVKEMRIQMEELEDTVKQLCKVQGQVKELRRKLEYSRAAQKEVLSSTLESERRAKAMEGDLIQLQEELLAAERARKQAEAKKDKLSEELASSSSGKSLLSVDKRRLEAKIRHLEEEQEEVKTDLESFKDQLRKSQQLVDQLGVDLARECSFQSRDGSRQQLERLRATLQEIGGQGPPELQSCIAAFKSKLREAEERLELERRKRQSNAKALSEREEGERPEHPVRGQDEAGAVIQRPGGEGQLADEAAAEASAGGGRGEGTAHGGRPQ